jgi:hypothetical protein
MFLSVEEHDDSNSQPGPKIDRRTELLYSLVPRIFRGVRQTMQLPVLEGLTNTAA